MPEKIKGTVKWFSNRKGFGFITPTSDNAPSTEDIFVHQSSIVTEADYRTLKDGLEVEFEAVTDESGKLKAEKVTCADGSACPGPEPRKKRTKAPAAAASDGDAGANADASPEQDNQDEKGGAENGEGKKANGKKPRRRKRNNAKGAPAGANGDSAAAPATKPAAAKKPESWESGLDEAVKKSMADRKITVNGGRAFLAIGDARVKLGTDGYAALAHSTAILAEGSWTVEPTGLVKVTWDRVLKLADSAWVPTTAEDAKAVLVTEINLTDDSVKPTGTTETTDSLWGEGKADPKDALESNGFQMRKMLLNASQAGSGRRRGRARGRRPNNKTKGKSATE